MSLVPHEEIDFAPVTLPGFAAMRSGWILFRPWSPRGRTGSGLWLERNPHHPKIWGWVIAIAHDDRARYPTLAPGAMIVVARHQGEPFDTQASSLDGEIEETRTILLPIEAVMLAIDPPLNPLVESKAIR